MRYPHWRSLFLSFTLGLMTNSIFFFCLWVKPTLALYAPIDRRCPQEQLNKYLAVLKNTISILDIPEEKYDERDGARAIAGERSHALLALSFCGAKVVPILRDELRRENGIFGSALTALQYIGPEAKSATPEIAKFMYNTIEKLDKPSHDEHWEDIYYFLPHVQAALYAIANDEKSTVSDLLKLLKREKDNKKRILIAEALDALGEHGIASSILLSLTKEKDTKIRRQVANALVNISPSPDTVSALIELLSDKETCISEIAALAPGQLGSNAANAIPYLQKAVINSRDIQVKNSSALSLISLGFQSKGVSVSKILTKDVVSAIMSVYTRKSDLENTDCYEDGNYIALSEVLESLSIVASVPDKQIPGLASAIPDLINIAKDSRENFETRAAAVNLLGSMGNTQAKSRIPELRKLFYAQLKAGGMEKFTSWNDRAPDRERYQEIIFAISIARALGKLGETNTTIPYLIYNLKASNFYTKNIDSEVFLPFDTDIAGSAVKALSDIGFPTLPYLLNEISSLKSLQRRAAVYVLYNLSLKRKLPQDASSTLMSILKNKNIELNTRRIAAYGLEESGVNVSWFFSKNGLISPKHLVCLPDSYAEYYDDQYDLFTGKCKVQARGDGGPNLFYRIKEILFPSSKH